MSEIDGYRFAIVTFVLIFLIIGVSVLLYLSITNLNDKSITLPSPNQNSHCLNPSCPGGTTANPVNIPTGTETINYCSVNAAPTSFVQALQVCGGTIVTGACGTPKLPAITSQQVTSFADFYNNRYIDSCSGSWNDVPNALNNTDTLPAETTINALLACSNKMGLSNDPNIQSLKTKCGSACS